MRTGCGGLLPLLLLSAAAGLRHAPLRAPPRARASAPRLCDGSDTLNPAEYTRALLSDEAEVAQLMGSFGLAAGRPTSLPQRGVFCTRELDLRNVKVIGYDMDS